LGKNSLSVHASKMLSALETRAEAVYFEKEVTSFDLIMSIG
jgi:hypothetical protein